MFIKWHIQLAYGAHCPPETEFDQQKKLSQYFPSHSASKLDSTYVRFYFCHCHAQADTLKCALHIKILYNLRLVCILQTTEMCRVFDLFNVIFSVLFFLFLALFGCSAQCEIQVAQIFSLIFIIFALKKSQQHILYAYDGKLNMRAERCCCCKRPQTEHCLSSTRTHCQR